MEDIIGPAFAGEEFLGQIKTLPDQPFYTLEQLCEFFPREMDVPQLLALLDHMDLVHETSGKKFLLPGKLPIDIPEIGWDVEEAHDVKGMSIVCAKEIDIFNPNVFPCVQKKILDTHGKTVKVSRSGVEFAMSSIRVVVHLTKHKRSINVAVTVPNKESKESSYQSLQYAVELIQEELSVKSPGTDIEVKYISPRSLKSQKTLEDVVTYSKDSLIEAEMEEGVVVHDGRPEQVSQILFQGCDTMFVEEFGSECPYEWLPVDKVERCFARLDRVHDRMEDYRFLGKLLCISCDKVNDIAENSRRRDESATSNIIKTWCKTNKRKMTIGMLHSLLMKLSLVDNVESVKIMEEVLKMYKQKVYRVFQVSSSL